MGSVKISVGGTWKDAQSSTTNSCSACKYNCTGKCHGTCDEGCTLACRGSCGKNTSSGGGTQYGTGTGYRTTTYYTGKINISGTSKQISTTKANIGGTWKTVK